MTMTTIKVSTETRDRLKAQAAHAHRSLGEHLQDLADLSDRRARFDTLRRAIGSDPNRARHEYERETSEWERTELVDAVRGED